MVKAKKKPPQGRKISRDGQRKECLSGMNIGNQRWPDSKKTARPPHGTNLQHARLMRRPGAEKPRYMLIAGIRGANKTTATHNLAVFADSLDASAVKWVKGNEHARQNG